MIPIAGFTEHDTSHSRKPPKKVSDLLLLLPSQYVQRRWGIFKTSTTAVYHHIDSDLLNTPPLQLKRRSSSLSLSVGIQVSQSNNASAKESLVPTPVETPTSRATEAAAGAETDTGSCHDEVEDDRRTSEDKHTRESAREQIMTEDDGRSPPPEPDPQSATTPSPPTDAPHNPPEENKEGISINDLTPIEALQLICRYIDTLYIPASPPPPALSPTGEKVNPFLEYSPCIEGGQETKEQWEAREREEKRIQRDCIARRFWSKAPVGIGLEGYLRRIHTYCPMSTAVYIAVGRYLHRLVNPPTTPMFSSPSSGSSVSSTASTNTPISVTPLNIHRLALASLRLAQKFFEDKIHSQGRFAKVGGVAVRELGRLEVGLLFLLEWEVGLGGDVEGFVRGMGEVVGWAWRAPRPSQDGAAGAAGGEGEGTLVVEDGSVQTVTDGVSVMATA
ncbi:hypothetical protein YB2330_001481 [Saitoella coloradoensis]